MFLTLIIRSTGDPLELKQTHPAIYERAYGAGDPITDKVDEFLFQKISSWMPSRSTHTSLCQNVMFDSDAMSKQSPKSIEGLCDLPGFKLCAPKKMPSPEVEPKGLCDPDPEEAQAPPPPKAVLDTPKEDPCPKPSGVKYALEDAPPCEPDLESPSKKPKKDIDSMSAHLSTLLFGKNVFKKAQGQKGSAKQNAGSDVDNDEDNDEDEPPFHSPKAKPAKGKAKAKAKTTPPKDTPPKHVKPGPPKGSPKGSPKNSGKVKLLVPFPGVPKKSVEPMEFKDMRIYSDITRGMWRVKRVGFRKDRGASWKADPAAAWNTINLILSGTIKIPKD